ncbi:hypothetical protein PanWU01x14_296100 [Parasponia andersonii]|uniref:Uncharacterized protein n=1 Tax=Parasponia andersonii TaxID=3476 RepID=A0A2P5AVQ2_PARAD|nr:hypothetical protein PanWU01x14_296100 [Parasponia andersonii]
MATKHRNTLDSVSSTVIEGKDDYFCNISCIEQESLYFMLALQKEIYARECEPSSFAIRDCYTFKQYETFPGLLVAKCDIYMPEKFFDFGASWCKMKILVPEYSQKNPTCAPSFQLLGSLPNGREAFLWPTKS